MLKKILIGSTAIIMSLSAVGCGVESWDQINTEYSTEAVDVTLVSCLNGAEFHVPDSFLEQAEAVESGNSYSLTSDDFVIEARVLASGTFGTSTDKDSISADASGLFNMDLTATKVTTEDNVVKSKIKSDKMQGYVLAIDNQYVILALTKKQSNTAETVVDSLELKSNKTVQGSSGLTLTINDMEVGSSVSVDKIKSDFAEMEQTFNDTKAELSYVNGQTISEISDSVTMQFNKIQSESNDVEQYYLQSVTAYNDAVNDYNIALSNGITFDSEREEIEKAFGITIKPEGWDEFVYESDNAKDSIQKMILEFQDGQISKISINPENSTVDATTTLDSVADSARPSYSDFYTNYFSSSSKTDTAGAVSDNTNSSTTNSNTSTSIVSDVTDGSNIVGGATTTTNSTITTSSGESYFTADSSKNSLG